MRQMRQVSQTKKGFEPVMSIFWFVALVMVMGGIVWITHIYYGAPYDVRGIESTALADQIENCMISQGYLNSAVLSGDFEKNFMSFCHLNFSVENLYGWTNNSEYYAEVHVYKFDENNNLDLLGNELLNISEGNQNLKTQEGLQYIPNQVTSTISVGVNKIVISTEGSTVDEALKTTQEKGFSIHYLIAQDGTIFSSSSQYSGDFVPESNKGSYAECNVGGGEAQSCPAGCISQNGLLKSECQQLGGNLPKNQWCCIPNYNVNSIGIELVNAGNISGVCKLKNYETTPTCLTAVSAYGDLWESFSSAQINSLVNLVSGIAARYNIPLDRNHIIGDSQISTYETSPGPAFPWNSFMEQLNARGAVTASLSQKDIAKGERIFYATDESGNQYVVTVLTDVGKDEKNVAQ